ncbi:MAG: restriction endonuclease subunit S [Acholeplasma sp.]|jgi:type I restriction enzyme S subunit|nr:restriction endonuclease subunit S [Acholeplasma sp.]
MGYSLGEILGNKGYIRGPFGSALKRSEMLDKGIPVYEQQNAIYNHREFRFYINHDKFEKMKRFTVQEGDILISCSGTVGKTTLITENDPIGIISQALLILRPDKKKTDSRFLKYFLDSKAGQEGLLARAHGSVQTNIAKRQDVETLIIPELSLAHQKSIANILSSLDDKIELNNKINKNLEELAQTLYKRWFVDFEFPNESGEQYKSSGGEMVESEFGLIPKGWRITPIGDICDTVLGGTPSRKIEEYWNGDINWINSGEINHFRIIKPSEFITKYGLNNSSTKMMPKKTTVIAITGATLGAVSLLEIDACANQSVIGILQNDQLAYTFIYPTIMNRISDIIGRQTGGAQQHINKNDVNSFRIILPDGLTLKKYHSTTDALYNEIANRVFQNDKLSQLRDELLPKLMNGEIEVPIEE